MILINDGEKSGLSFSYPLEKKRVRVIPWLVYKKKLPLLAATSGILFFLQLILFNSALFSELLFDLATAPLLAFMIIRIWVVRATTIITIMPSTILKVAPILVWIDWIALYFAVAMAMIHQSNHMNAHLSTPFEMLALFFVYLALLPVAKVVILLLRNKIN